MSEIFDLMHQALEVVQTAKDAMGHSLAADATTQSLARTILDEAKRLLPNDRIVQSVNLPSGDAEWVSVRSAMQAVANSLSTVNMSAVRATIARRARRF
jgi:hypothetical protein